MRQEQDLWKHERAPENLADVESCEPRLAEPCGENDQSTSLAAASRCRESFERLSLDSVRVGDGDRPVIDRLAVWEWHHEPPGPLGVVGYPLGGQRQCLGPQGIERLADGRVGDGVATPLDPQIPLDARI